jgi:hypothetical protein
MKRFILIFGMMGAGLCNHVALAATSPECFASAAAAFAAHPNGAHASYTVRGKRSERCWYVDAFNAKAKAVAKPASRPVARVAPTSSPHPAITAPVPQGPTAGATRRSRSLAVGSASPPMIVPIPYGIAGSIQTAVNAQELDRLFPVEDRPADFESRFSASGYNLRK